MKEIITIKCRGVSPLLMHPVTENHRRREIVSISKNSPETLLVWHDGKISIPTSWILESLILGGSTIMGGNRKIIRRNVFIESGFIPLTTPSAQPPSWELYNHPRHIKSRKSGHGGIGLVRCPQFNEWGFEVKVSFNDPPFSAVVVRQMFVVAGKKAGVGLFSPTLGTAYANQFGKFEVIA